MMFDTDVILKWAIVFVALAFLFAVLEILKVIAPISG